MLLALRFIFLCIIILGIFHFFSDKLSVKNDYIPFISMTSIGLILYLGGLLNIMSETVIFIIFLSLSYIVYILKTKKSIKKLYSPGIVFFIVGSLFFVLLFKGRKFYSYDDFSHWALVTREILVKDRFPNFTDELISFQTYPTGSASFIYFFGKILGNSEGVMLFAQNILCLSCISPIFSLINTKKIHHYFFVFLYTIFLFTSNNGITSLYVDTLITAITFCLTTIIVSSYIDDKLYQAFLPVTIGNAFLVVVKNSGILFASINIVLILLLIIINRSWGDYKKVFPILVIPWFTRMLWSRHTELVFDKALETKHSISLDAYQNIFQNKSIDDINKIIVSLIKRSINFRYLDVNIFGIIFIFFVIILFIRKIILKREFSKSQLIFLGSITTLYFLYQLGLLSTYIFSMPISEALALASYERYNITLTVYILGVFLLYFFIKESRHSNFNYLLKLVVLLLLSFSVYQIKDNITTAITNESFKEFPRNEFLRISSSNEINKNQKVIIYVSDITEDYAEHFLNYIARYDLRTKNFRILDENKINQLPGILNKEDVTLIILKRDTIIEDYISSYGYDNIREVFNMSIGE